MKLRSITAIVGLLGLAILTPGCTGSETGDADLAGDSVSGDVAITESGGPADPSETTQGPLPTLECEEDGFPCTWGEVPDEIVERGAEVARIVMDSLESGQTLEDIGRTVFEINDVADVVIGSDALRFRIEGGRPEWVYTETTVGTLGAPPAVPFEVVRPASEATAAAAGTSATTSPTGPLATTGDPAGEQKDKPTKRALILSPFTWQWRLFSKDDKVDEITALFRASRDYADSTTLIQNTIALQSGSESGSAGAAPQIMQNVTIASFKGWDQYDAIHVSTHGSNVCDKFVQAGGTAVLIELDPCHTGLMTSELWTGADPGMAAGKKFANQDGLYRTWLSGGSYLATWASAFLGPGAALRGNGEWDVGPFMGASTDFFKREYPNGLSEALVFLNACHSGENSGLINHLSQQNSTVIGWSDELLVEDGAEAAECFWRTTIGPQTGSGGGSGPNDRCQGQIDLVMLDNYGLNYTGGATIEDAFQVVRSMMNGTGIAPVVSQGGITLSDGPTGSGGTTGALAGAAIFPTGDERNRAIEIIRMMEAATPREFQDGDFITLTGTAGDGVPDTLVAELEVFGIGPTDDPDGMTLYVDVGVGGNTQSKSMTLLPQTPSPDKRRTLSAIPLDVDLPPGGTLDLEVWVEYADGTSRWRYEDLDYDCTIPNLGDFQASITGGVGRTVLRGENSQAGLRPWPQGGWVLNLRNRYDSDFDLGVIIPGAPVAGQSYQVQDESMQPPFYFSGGIDYDTPDKAGWFLGDATVHFDKVTPDGACGTVNASLTGLQSGAITPRRLQADITLRFWAETR